MATFLTAAAAAAVSFITLGTNMLPPAPSDIKTNMDAQVRIHAALFDERAYMDSLGSPPGYSTAPALAAFNEAGDPIGVANTDWTADDYLEIFNGNFRDYTIEQTGGPGQPVQYLQLYATGTPICLAGITMRWSDGIASAFSGDFGRTCGAAWYYSNINFDEKGYQPDCVWVDSGVRNNHYDVGEECLRVKDKCSKLGISCPACDIYDITPLYQFPSGLRFLPKALQYTVSNFGLRPLLSTDPNAYCTEDYLTFRHRLNVVFYPQGKGDPNIFFDINDVTLFQQGSDLNEVEMEPRDTPASSESASYGNYYITSANPDHSAIRLCTSVTSLGPDFFSEKEQKFCDMAPASGTKRLYDACSNPVDQAKLPCWDKEKHELRRPEDLRKRGSSRRYNFQVAWDEAGARTVNNLLEGLMKEGLLANVTNGFAKNATLGRRPA